LIEPYMGMLYIFLFGLIIYAIMTYGSIIMSLVIKVIELLIKLLLLPFTLLYRFYLWLTNKN
jgi:hypothetical protein